MLVIEAGSFMEVCSFRAECKADLDALCDLFSKHEVRGFLMVDGLEVELLSNLPLISVRNYMECMVDSHVMIETLRPVALADNSLERVG
jgi:hypothetical protein